MSSALTQYGTRGGTIGRPPCDDRATYYTLRFGLKSDRRRAKILTWKLLDQLDACQSDCARRLILGVSEKWYAGQEREIA